MKKEEKVFYRQMNLKNQQKSSDESMPKMQQAMYMMVDKEQQIMTHHDVQSVQVQHAEIDEEADEATFANDAHKTYVQPYDHVQFMSLQQQHFIPHSKLHSMDRFAMPAAMIPQPVPHNVNHPHEQFDHELSLNETDNEEEFKPKKAPIVTAFSNGVQMEFVKNSEVVNTNNNQGNPAYEETSIIDLNELNEEQLKQLQAEEEKQQSEYFNIDHLNRLYCQAQFLYKIRGKKLEEVTNRFTAYQEDMNREIRAMKHRVYLAEKEKESVESSVEQMRELCGQYKTETESNKKSVMELQDKYDKLKQTNLILEQKIVEQEQEIDALQTQIEEQQKLDALERLEQQHEHFVQQLREQTERDMLHMRERLNAAQAEMEEKSEMTRLMRIQLEAMTKNSEMVTIEHSETVSRLTRSLAEIQSKHEAKSDDRCKELEEKVKFLESANNSTDFYIPNLSASTNDASNNLHKELERSMNALKQKRLELQKCQAELERLRHEKTTSNIENNDLQRLNCLIDELQKEKNELSNELTEKNVKIDELMGHEEEWQQLRQRLEIDIYDKQQDLNQCQLIIEKLHSELNVDQIINGYEAQLGELKLKLANREHEVQKMRDMYIEICNDKNNLQETLKAQYDEEYEIRLRQRLDASLDEQRALIRDKFERDRQGLIDEYRRQVDSCLNDTKTAKEQVNCIERQRDQLRVEKSGLELKLSRTETEFREKCTGLERALRDSEMKLHEKESEFFSLKAQIEELNEEQKSTIQGMTRDFEAEKEELISKMEKCGQERQMLKNEQKLLSENLDSASCKLNEVSIELENEKSNLKICKTKLDEAECKIKTLNETETRLKEISNRSETMAKELKSGYELKIKDLELKLNELAMNKLEDEKKLKDMEFKLETIEKGFNKAVMERDAEIKKLEALRLKQTSLGAKYEQAVEAMSKDFETKMQTAQNDAAKHFESARLEWNAEKMHLVNGKEEEMRRCIEQLEKRFEQDYSKFIQAHKDSMHKTLSEKSAENSKEKEKLIEMYEKKIGEREANEKLLSRQIKELKEKEKLNSFLKNKSNIEVSFRNVLSYIDLNQNE